MAPVMTSVVTSMMTRVVFPNANIASKSTLSSDAVTMGVNYKF